MFLASLGENGNIKWNQIPLSSQTTYVATIYFSGKKFSQTVSCFKYGFQIASDAKLEIYFADT